ncbi:hypothetical protein A2U01_0020890, partial [Trifolium medium]|nr:hypothetical protein [Trifolium medium]
ARWFAIRTQGFAEAISKRGKEYLNIFLFSRLPLLLHLLSLDICLKSLFVDLSATVCWWFAVVQPLAKAAIFIDFACVLGENCGEETLLVNIVNIVKILSVHNLAGFTRARERLCVEEIVLVELVSLQKLRVENRLPVSFLRENL